jgi:hypothetical protein
MTSVSISSRRFSSSSWTRFSTSSDMRFCASSSTIFCSRSFCRLNVGRKKKLSIANFHRFVRHERLQSQVSIGLVVLKLDFGYKNWWQCLWGFEHFFF